MSRSQCDLHHFNTTRGPHLSHWLFKVAKTAGQKQCRSDSSGSLKVNLKIKALVAEVKIDLCFSSGRAFS